MPDENAGAPPAVVGPWLAEHLGDPAWADVRVELVAGGKSNLTYLLSSSAGDAVLRRPPLGHVLPTAHDMVREHTVISALGPTDVPVPQTLALCTDRDVLGADFYVMERVRGHIVRESFPPGYADTPQQRRAVGDGLVDTLVALHAVAPEAVGLGSFGKPEGYLDRQLRRWTSQHEASLPDPAHGLDALLTDLRSRLPESPPATVVHGDYRLDNTMLHPTVPGRLAAVLDWEMSTRGDPLADLGVLLVYWAQADDPAQRRQGLGASATALPGFPTRVEVADRYAAQSGRDVSTLPWYVAWGWTKLAVVVEGIVARVKAGAYGEETFGGIERAIPALADAGREALARGELT